MIIVLKSNPNPEQYEQLKKWLEDKGLDIHKTQGIHSTILGLVGDTSKVDIDLVSAMEIVDGKSTDEMIYEELPSQDKRWWCKVEDGYIINLLGEKKNKEPYKYNSSKK